MIYSEPARVTIHRTRIRRTRVVALLVVVAAIGATLGYRVLASSTPAGFSLSTPSPSGTTASSVVPDGTTVFDDEIPGVARLDPALLGALRQAATDSGVAFRVDSGWRSPEYQARLLREAVAKYGSAEEAARWVASPETSAHVSGDAVDIGPASVAAWLSEHGARYGLCQIYANEPWHYELRPEAVDGGCPPMYADARKS